MDYKEELKKLLHDFYDGYQKASEESRKKYLTTLPQGTKVPEPGALYSNEDREQFNKKVLEFNEKVRTLVDLGIQELKDKLTAVPSEEAIKSIELLNVRAPINGEEYKLYLEKYGDNTQCRDTIISIARRNGVELFGDYEDTYDQIDRLKNLERSIRGNFDTYDAEAGRVTPALISVYEMQIDGNTLFD